MKFVNSQKPRKNNNLCAHRAKVLVEFSGWMMSLVFFTGELMGHKTLAMTLRYAHLAPSHKVKALEVLDGAMKWEGKQKEKVVATT